MYEITTPYHWFGKQEIEEIKRSAQQISDNLNQLSVDEVLKAEIRASNEEIQLFERCPDIESCSRLYELYVGIACIIKYGVID